MIPSTRYIKRINKIESLKEYHSDLDQGPKNHNITTLIKPSENGHKSSDLLRGIGRLFADPWVLQELGGGRARLVVEFKCAQQKVLCVV